jgi:hypothetical protein
VLVLVVALWVSAASSPGCCRRHRQPVGAQDGANALRALLLLVGLMFALSAPAST